MSLTLTTVVSASLLDSINPCAFSVLLITVGFLVSLNRSRSYIFKTGLLYIAGIFITYFLIGLGSLRALSLFGFPHTLAKIAAVILAGVSLINLLEQFIPNFPIKLKIPSASHPILAKFIHQSTLPSAFILGILVGLFEFPCTGGPYLLILGLLHDSSTFWSGFRYLALYNFIFISPLILILLMTNDQRLTTKFQSWRKSNSKQMQILSSLAMMALAVIIFLTS